MSHLFIVPFNLGKIIFKISDGEEEQMAEEKYDVERGGYHLESRKGLQMTTIKKRT